MDSPVTIHQYGTDFWFAAGVGLGAWYFLAAILIRKVKTVRSAVLGWEAGNPALLGVAWLFSPLIAALGLVFAMVVLPLHLAGMLLVAPDTSEAPPWGAER